MPQSVCRTIALHALAFAILVTAACGPTDDTPAADAPPAATPPIRVVDGLFDRETEGTVGLSSIEGEHAMLYRASEDGYKFCHHPNLVLYQDRLYAMWSNGLVGEDMNGQRVLYSHTTDGMTWTEPEVLADDPDGPDGPFAGVAAGFHVAGDTLVAYNTAIMDQHPIHADNALYARTSTDGTSWGEPQRIGDGFFIERPCALPSGRLLIAGQWVNKQPRLLYTDSPDGIAGWTDGTVPDSDAFQFPEPNWFLQPDGTIVMLFRTNNDTHWLYASTSTDQGETWSAPAVTNFPDSTARFSTGNLPDGTAYVISNPASHLVRIPLTIALSKDGVTFDRAFVLRGEPTEQRWEGLHKLRGWQYPSSLVWNGSLYVAYSINKEDVGVTRIPLTALTL